MRWNGRDALKWKKWRKVAFDGQWERDINSHITRNVRRDKKMREEKDGKLIFGGRFRELEKFEGIGKMGSIR